MKSSTTDALKLRESLFDPLYVDGGDELVDPLIPEAEDVLLRSSSAISNDLSNFMKPFLDGSGVTWSSPEPVEPLPTWHSSLTPKAFTPKDIEQTIPLPQLKKAPTPYSVAQAVASAMRFWSRSGVQYVFNEVHGVYQKTTERDLVGLIYQYARAAVESEGRPSFARDVVRILMDDARFQVPEWAFAPQFIAFKNATLDIRRQVTWPHSPDRFVTRAINASWTSGAPHEAFDRFLQFATGGEDELIDRIWAMLGYILVPDNAAKCIFILEGVPNSGKSLLVNLLRYLIDPLGGAFVSIDSNELSRQFALSALADVALCVAPDMPNAPLSKKTVGILKALSGGDAVSSDQKYRGRIQFHFSGKIVLVTNHELQIKEADEAFEDRLIRIPFRYAVPRAKQNRELLELLLREADGIATHAIYKYWNLVESRYQFPGQYERPCIMDTMDNQTRDWQIAEFFHGNVVNDSKWYEFIDDLWNGYREQTNSNIALSQFGSVVSRLFPELNARHVRQRKSPGLNPQAAIQGIRLIGKENDINADQFPSVTACAESY